MALRCWEGRLALLRGKGLKSRDSLAHHITDGLLEECLSPLSSLHYTLLETLLDIN